MPSKTTVGWQVWYDDGSIYDSDNSDWSDLPDDGVLVKMIYYSDGTRQIQQGADYFFIAQHHSGEEIHANSTKTIPEIKDRYQNPIIKKGRWAPDEYYQKIVDEAMSSKWDYGN